MVSDIKQQYRSHPNKLLHVHIEGVRDKALRHICHKGTPTETLVYLAAMFHDLGKINPNFQAKLSGKQPEGYSSHAYLSAYGLLCLIATKPDYIKRYFEESELMAWLPALLMMIRKHHGHLQNLPEALGQEELERLKIFLQEKGAQLPVSDYLNALLSETFPTISVRWNERLTELFWLKDKKRWASNALNYFSSTQYAFASLIEGDKRDAGNLVEEDWTTVSSQWSEALGNRLTALFNDFAAHPNAAIPLNERRTAMRKQAVHELKSALTEGKRAFQLTAPTGAGKTLMLLALASVIQEKSPEHGIIFCLPFLSITEQVEGILKNDLGLSILSATSKSRNKSIEDIQQELEDNPNAEVLKLLLQEIYDAHTFNHPFVVTTFVQFFETLMSNRNSRLLKLPNFRKRIFILDEIQSLPPHLYTFFAAWLHHFCKQHDAYVIFSSATMPSFQIPDRSSKHQVRTFFKDFCSEEQPICAILNAQHFFKAAVFNRYRIENLADEDWDLERLAAVLAKERSACLVILNTIGDTKELYALLKNQDIEVLLLNTHFTPLDRSAKIAEAKQKLENEEHFILISTQLIEAGVDISFPVLYRDLCPLPSLIQSAGRCNRNGELGTMGGCVRLIALRKENGKLKAELIYRQHQKRFLTFLQQRLPNQIAEAELFKFQEHFFKEEVANNLEIGRFKVYDKNKDKNELLNLIEEMSKGNFATVGRLRLIETQVFGDSYEYYIRSSEKDDAFDELKGIVDRLSRSESYGQYAAIKSQINQKLQEMRERTVTVRSYDGQPPLVAANEEPLYGLYVLGDLGAYSYDEGIRLGHIENQFL